MKSRQVIVQCEGGLHLRVAAQIAKESRRCQSKVLLRCAGCPHADGCSIFELLKLGAVQGTRIEVTAEGPDEDATLAALVGVFDAGAGI